MGRFRSRPNLPPFSGHALRGVGKSGGRIGGVLEGGEGGESSGGGGSSWRFQHDYLTLPTNKNALPIFPRN